MKKPINVEFRSVGLSMRLDDATGPSTRGHRRYRLRLRNLKDQVALSYMLTLSELAALHSAITTELFQRRAELSRRTDGIFDPLRQERQQPEFGPDGPEGTAPSPGSEPDRKRD